MLKYAKEEPVETTSPLYAIVTGLTSRYAYMGNTTPLRLSNNIDDVENAAHTELFPSKAAAEQYIRETYHTGIGGTTRIFTYDELTPASNRYNSSEPDDVFYIASEPIATSEAGVLNLKSSLSKRSSLVPCAPYLFKTAYYRKDWELTGLDPTVYHMSATFRDNIFRCVRLKAATRRKRKTKNKRKRYASRNGFPLHKLQSLAYEYSRILNGKYDVIANYHNDRMLKTQTTQRERAVRYQLQRIPEWHSYHLSGPRSGSNTTLKDSNSPYFRDNLKHFQTIVSLMEAHNLYNQENRFRLRKQYARLLEDLMSAAQCKVACDEAKAFIIYMSYEARRNGVSGINPFPKEYPPCPKTPKLKPTSISHRPSWRRVRKQSRPRITSTSK